MNVVYLIGRIVLGVFFFYSGIHHFQETKMLAGYTKSKGVPAPTIAVVASGALLAVGGLMIILGWYVWIGALVLIVFLVPTAVIMHNFWTIKDPQMRGMDMTGFMKDIALAGALLMIMALSYHNAWNPMGLAH